MKNILIIYYSENGSTKKMAHKIALGVESTDAHAKVRTVPNVSCTTKISSPVIPENGDIYATQDDLVECSGLIVGSPSYFGNMASPLKYFLDKSTDLWFKGRLINKPVGFFTSASGMHSGHESTLISMMIPFIHHGCIIVGVPYSEKALEKTKTGGTPYGASHLSNFDSNQFISDDEAKICKALGKRVSEIASKISN